MAQDEPLFASVARLRLAWADADTMSKNDMQTLLAPLTDPSNAFHFMANELLAYVDYRLGNAKESGEHLPAFGERPGHAGRH